jgi:hypothetical protein
VPGAFPPEVMQLEYSPEGKPYSVCARHTIPHIKMGFTVWVLSFIIVFLPTSKENYIIPGNLKSV